MRGRGALAEANALRLVGFARARVLVRSVTRARGSRASDGVERSSANDESSPPLGGDGKASVWRKLAESDKESVFLRLLCVPRTPGSGIDLAVFARRGRSWTCTKVLVQVLSFQFTKVHKKRASFTPSIVARETLNVNR